MISAEPVERNQLMPVPHLPEIVISVATLTPRSHLYRPAVVTWPPIEPPPRFTTSGGPMVAALTYAASAPSEESQSVVRYFYAQAYLLIVWVRKLGVNPP